MKTNGKKQQKKKNNNFQEETPLKIKKVAGKKRPKHRQKWLEEDIEL